MLEATREETSSKADEGGPDTKEAEALAAALNHSAERVQTLWFSFLTFMVYLAIAAGTTTHRMLFLESPLKLPVLNIDLPLLGFYILAPIIFVVFHFYMLLNLVLLARTAKSFEDSLARAFPEDGEARENFRMRIENTLFVQLLVGGRLEREGINAKLLSLMALITLAVAPVALLLLIQIKFLPYHSEWITWLHRGTLSLDFVLLWTLWPGCRSGWGERLRPTKSSGLAPAGIWSAVALLYAGLWATFPGEKQHMFLTKDWSRVVLGFSNTLFLSGENLVDDPRSARIIEKNESSPGAARWGTFLPGATRSEPTLSLWKRDMTDANLSGANLQYVDFTDAIFNGAKLDGAKFRGTSFNGAHLQGAFLSHTQLQGASLDNAQLQGALLVGAQLQGASLQRAQLQGAWLVNAQLQGAWLGGVQLQGAILNNAQLWFAILNAAHLEGASLDGAELQGASLDGAQLQGASLYRAQLQGAFFKNAYVWRADARSAYWKDTRVDHLETEQKFECLVLMKDTSCNWTADTFENLKEMIFEQIPEGNLRHSVIERIETRLDPTKPLDGENEMAQAWSVNERALPSQEGYETSLAEQWIKAGCAVGGAPYVVRSLLNRLDVLQVTGAKQITYTIQDTTFSLSSQFDLHGPEVPKLAAAFLDKDCAGARGLSQAEIAKLKDIAAKAPPPAPKQ